ncbi:DEAD/DEAH box helicase [Aestuariimicrobium sp. p3-SID1156]|uniref:DEAD/DEAH box helicase n=1 Tax=Aestuariimicrobium sp. p3-SID1156 TaxID=2916038 RepID=UPI00223B8FA5|nr:DEAD/DEAH box helicase [Aestuariimicrobium sp. p3-SID1156]MCT1460247.1 DEAD/DEAH box helicase [Aestuariimicrobium sp. p3-SID1156]
MSFNNSNSRPKKVRGPKAANSKKGPKSSKADGTPKKRWSAAERAERGHAPRRSGGVRSQGIEPRFGSGRPRSGGEQRSFERDAQRSERPARRDDFRRDDFRRDDFRRDDFRRDDFRRDQRGDRQSSWGRQDRPQRGFDREDRPRDDRRTDERRSWGRDDRPQRSFDREDRGSRGWDRNDRPRNDRPRKDRFGGEDRGPREWNRDNRSRTGSWGRPERTERFERSDRFEKRDRFDRDESADEAQLDVMEWQQEEVEVDTSTVDTSVGFGELGLPAEIVGLLAQRGITTPFPIQVATIPDAMEGHDVLGRAKTGSGKTLAFGLPLVHRLSQGDEHKRNHGKSFRTPRAMVLVPTRELALQVADVVSPLASSLGLKLVLVAGGMSYGPQMKAFEKGVDIVVATPGRLIDLLEQGAADLSDVQVAVLDEADHMADLGFMPAVTTLLDAVSPKSQKLLFSATLDGAVDRLVRKYLKDPVLHEVDSDKGGVATMHHHVLLVRPHEKNAITAQIANREGRTVIFARTQLGSDRVANQLREAGVMAGALHGGLTQGARARILAAFKEGTLPVLVATDVAARGIHVDEVSLVLQLDPPMNGKDYTHRAGRTARAGEEGAVVSIVLPHQRRQTLRMIGSAGVKVNPVEILLGDPELNELTGATKPSGEAISEEDFKKLVAPRPLHKPRAQRDRDDRGAFGGQGRGRGGWKGGRRGGRDGGRGYGRSPRIAESGGWNKDR